MSGLGQLSIHFRQHSIHHLQDDDLRAESRVHAAELQADVAASDDDECSRHLVEGQGAAGGNNPVAVERNAGQLRLDRARGNDDVGGVQLGARTVGGLDLEETRPLEGRHALVPRHAVLLEQAAHSGGQDLDHLVLVSLHRREVDPHVADLDAKGTGAANLGDQVRSIEQSLRRNAPHVEAGAANEFLFDDGHMQAQLRGSQSGHVATGARPDDRYVDLGVGHERCSWQAMVNSWWVSRPAVTESPTTAAWGPRDRRPGRARTELPRRRRQRGDRATTTG